MKTVTVGSHNPTKLEAVQQAFTIVWPREQFKFDLLDAPSGVPEQPLGEEETIQGARNRARYVLDNSEADFAVGIEGGMYEVAGVNFVSDWAVVIDRQGREGIGGTPRYHVPEHLNRHVDAVNDLSSVLETKLGTKNIGKEHGYAGLMTGNHFTRTDSNRIAVVIALAPFVRGHYKDN